MARRRPKEGLEERLVKFQQDNLLCPLCKTNPANVIVLDCKHLSLYHDCIPNCLRCPQCRTTVIKHAVQLVQIETNYRNLLLKETQNIWIQSHCIRCQKMRRNVLFMNCYHVLVCTNCVPEVMECPVCLTPVSLVIIKEIFY